MIVRQSTARTILVGPVLDSTGAAKTDEVVASIKITKNGTVGSADGSATLTHDHAGKYKLALTANDCDTVGVLEISLNSGTNDMPVKACNVVETAIWDALFADGATGLLPANVTQISGDSGAADNAEAFFDGTGYAGTNNVIPTVSAVSGAVGSVTGNVGGNVVGSVGSVTAGVTVTTNNDKTGYSLTAGTGLGNQTADITGSLSGSVGSVSGAVGSVTGNVGGNVTGSVGSVVGLSAEVTKILDRLGYIMAQEIGACADAGTSAETYAITIDTTTYTIDHTGLDATGNRGTAALTKT